MKNHDISIKNSDTVSIGKNTGAIVYLTLIIYFMGWLVQPVNAGILNDDLDLAWASRRDLSTSQYSESFNKYRDQGYIITDVDGYQDGNQTRFAMVWRENTDNLGWAQWRNLTSSGYHEKWLQYKEMGYRPLDVEAYQDNGSIRYAGIWVENREGLGWYSFRNLTSNAYGEKFNELSSSGYRLVDMEAYQTSSGLRYAAIWLQNRENIAWAQLRNMTRQQYQTELDSRAANGFRVIDFESYQNSNGQQLYAAIWEKNLSGRKWVVRSDRTEVKFANYWREYRDKGYRLVDFERYQTQNGPRYAGIWMENKPTRLRYDRKDELDQLIEDYRTDNNLPGISVAVIDNGAIIYRRGFGFADVEKTKVAHGETVYLAASISKVIGGTLAAKLEAEQQLIDGTPIDLDLTQPTSTYLSDIPFLWTTVSLPEYHTHTVEELMSHSACIWHYSTGSEPAIQFYASSVSATMQIWNGQLLSNCTVGNSSNYSTHAFTFAGAAIERATGRQLDELLSDEIVQPHNLKSMRVQFGEATLPENYERAVPYGNDNSATSYSNNSWKVLGGGIEVSPVDLARFAWKTLDGQIVDADTRDNRLWTPVVPGRNTGLGWQLSTIDGSQVAQHGGSWTGTQTYLRVYRDDGLVVAVMSNRRNHTVGSVSGLTGNIADIVLAPDPQPIIMIPKIIKIKFPVTEKSSSLQRVKVPDVTFKRGVF